MKANESAYATAKRHGPQISQVPRYQELGQFESSSSHIAAQVDSGKRPWSVKVFWSQAEVLTYCKCLRDEDIAVSTKMLIVKALSIKMAGRRFLPFGTLVNVPMDRLVNMDETPVYFEPKLHTTISKKGSKTVSARVCSSHNPRVFVCLAVTATGEKLPLYVMFQGVPGARIDSSLEKIMPPTCLVVHKDGFNNTSVSFGALPLVFARGGAVVLYNGGNLVRKVFFLLQQAQREEADVVCFLADNKAEHLENLFQVPTFALYVKAATNQVVDCKAIPTYVMAAFSSMSRHAHKYS
ncbi:hypothetical protein H257_04900 [Aphanomyces astaci]|uniref:DDE-1 domain-containing protein n=1 Tax=Aphanomyces astaci TaxID=112090 RepID=W4GT70_APHAT|nr:hypothetical protein H257_04900 [Aphanomyces astaci]ETV82189.1 hypothetical protein H257_04900 [Aphanomyces astaci]|eukprot:XP_009827858.1 hypothetical protein H257_04900 [Aphanomyces astaci]